MKPQSAIRQLLLVGSIAAILATPVVQAANLTWDATAGGAINDGGGAWLGAGLWNNAGSPSASWTSGDDAIFGIGGAGGTVTLASPTTANSLTFNAFTATYTLGTAGQAITISTGITKSASAGIALFISPITLGGNQTWTNNTPPSTFTAEVESLKASAGINYGASTFTIDGVGVTGFTGSAITGSGDFIKNGAGTVVFNAASQNNSATFTGKIFLNGGVGRFQDTNNLSSGNIELNGGILEGRFGQTFTRAQGSAANQIQIIGGISGFSGQGGSVTTFNMGASVQWGSATFNPTVFMLQSAVTNTNGIGIFSSNIDLNGADRTIRSDQTGGNIAGSGTFSGVISNSTGTAGLIKTGIGHHILSATNTYNGSTTISQGTLTANSSAALGDSSATNTLVFTGGTLRAGGAITSAATRGVTLTSTGIIDTNNFAVSIAGAMNGGGGLTKNGSGTLTLTNTNNYSGVTTVSAGVRQFTNQAALYNNTPASWTAANINLRNGGTLAVNVDFSGAAGFDVANLNTLLTNISVAGSSTAGLQAGANLGFDTTTAAGGTFTQGNVLANSTGIFGGAIGLNKLGTGILVLDQTNTYTGPTVVTGGTLQLGNGTATGSLSASSVIRVGTGAAFMVNQTDTVTQGIDFSSSIITGSGGFSQAGSGTTVLNLANTFSGTTTVSAGTLSLTNALALQNSALVATGTGTVTLSGVSAPTFGGLSGATGDLTSVITSGYSGVTALTLNSRAGSVTYGGVIADGASGMSLTKTGAGTQVMQGVNAYTGATTFRAGTLELSGAGSLLTTSGVTLTGGGLTLTNAASETGSGRLHDTNVITSLGGTITYANTSGANIYGELIGSVALTSGQLNVVENTNQAGAGTQTLTLGGLTHTGSANTSAVTFSAASTAPNATKNIIAVSGALQTTLGQIIAPWATTGTDANTQTDYAIYNASGQVVPSAITNSPESGWTNPLNAYTGNTGAAITLTGLRQVNALQFLGASATLALSTFNLETSGLLFPGANAMTVSSAGGNLTTASGGGNLYITVGRSGIIQTVSAVIANNGGNVTLVKNGAGTLVLSGVNSYGGGTVINAGQITVTSDANLGAAGGGVTFNGSAVISPASVAYARNVTINNGATASFDGGGSTFSGNVTGTGGIAITNTFGSQHTFSGTANTFQGPVNIGLISGTTGQAYRATFASLADSAIANGRIIFSASSVTHGNGSVFEYTGGTNLVLNNRQFELASAAANPANGHQIRGNGTGALTVNTDLIVSTTPAQTLSLGGSNSANIFAGRIGDGSGAVISLIKADAGNWILSGANTYTGKTTINAGTLSINSIQNTGSVTANSLGTPAAGLNSVIDLATGTLRYTGSGHSSNRVINLTTVAGGAFTLDASGSLGTFALTGGVTSAGTSGISTLTLAGSASGSESGSIVNGTGTNVTAIAKNGIGTWTLAGANTYSGTTTVNLGSLTGSQSGGTPFGTGAVTIGAGILSLSPFGSGADVSVTGGNVANANNFTYNADALFSLNKGTNNSLTYTFSRTNAAVGFARGTNGTMILSVGAIGNLGNTIASGGERFVITAATVPVTLVNNLASAVVAQDRGNSNAGDFVTYDLTDGFRAAVADVIDTFSGSANTSYVSITLPSISTGGAVTAYALKVSGQTLTNTSTLTLGGSVAGVASLILNSGTISGGTSLTTPTGLATELVVYTSGTSEISTPILTATSQAGMSIIGPGSLALTSATANNFSGGLRINNSTVIATNDNQLGASTSSITLTGGTLQISGTVALGGAAQRAIILAAGQDQTGGTFNVTSGTTTYQNSSVNTKVMSGAGSLTKTGAGTLALIGNTTNTYTGGTFVNVGTLQLGASAMLADAGAVTMSGGTLDIGGSSDTVGPVTLISGNINGTTGVLTGTAYDLRSGSVSAILAGINAALTKTTGGTVTLSGANTYTGATTVSAGTLEVNGSLSGSATTVGNTGVLKGSGSITGAVTVQTGGTLAAGNSIESLATGALSFNGGSTFAYELNNDAAPSVAGDLTAITGNFTLAVTNTTNITFTELGAGSWAPGEKLTLASYSGTWNGGLFNFGSVVADDSTINFGGTDWTFNYNDASAGTNFTGDLTGTNYVTITAVPEPGAVMSLLAGLGVLALVRRRRA